MERLFFHRRNFFIGLATCHCWHFYAATIGIALEAEFHRLPCANGGVPTNTSSAVGIAAAQGGIPGTGDAIAPTILPTGSPAGFGAGAGVGDADRTGKT